MIHVYTQPDCIPCKQAIQMLEESGVDYRIYDISKSNTARRFVIEKLGASSTPVIYRPVSERGGDIVIGFLAPAQAKLREIIKAESPNKGTVDGVEGFWLD